MRGLSCLFSLLVLVAAFPAHAQTKVPFAQAQARAKAIVRRMTLDEKIEEVHGIRTPQFYRYIPGIPKLGILAMQITNGPAGAGPGGAGPQQRATALPAPIALAASWDPALARKYGVLAGEETRSLGNDLLEAPDVNIARVPQNGRDFESFGEDPLLDGRMAVGVIDGIQSTGVMANVKHFVANNQETDRRSINEVIAERPLREIYFPAFRASVEQGHVASVMCAYPRVNGAYNCENPLLNDVLRRDWKFDGFIISDFGATHTTVPSALNGLDVEYPTGKYFGDDLKQAIADKQVPESTLDAMLVRRFTKMIEYGWFGPQRKPAPIPVLEHGAIARSIAEQGMVLLKNENGLLPLDNAKIRRLALIGPYALGGATGGGGSSHVIPTYTIDPVDGIGASLLVQIRPRLNDGCDIADAVKLAKASDVAIVMVGDTDTEGSDQPIALSEHQNDLVEAVAAANPKTVVVVKSGSAVLLPWIDKVAAVLEAWYPGQEDGNAVADVLFGKVNPSGKLPITFPRSEDQTLAADRSEYPGNGTEVHYSEGLNVGYRGYQAKDVKPMFPFGFGLSYTTFAFSDLTVQPRPEGATVSFRVTNTGSRPGAEVAQLYVTFPPIAEGNEPPHQLKGFDKVELQPGQSRTVHLELTAPQLSYWSESHHAWQLAHGEFSVAVGDSSADTPLAAKFTIR